MTTDDVVYTAVEEFLGPREEDILAIGETRDHLFSEALASYLAD